MENPSGEDAAITQPSQDRRLYQPLIEAAEKKSDFSERGDLISELLNDLGRDQNRLYQLETRYWLRRAQRYHVPGPQREGDADENWEPSSHLGLDHVHLTDAGISRVRKAIREEQKWRRDRLLAWMGAFSTLIMASTGLIGTLIGFAAIRAHH